MLFGTILLTIAHIYWGEIHFESYLVQFRGEGTYTESKFRTGKSILDSTESENTLVRTSFSPWVLMTRIVSSTQAKPGASSFSYARYVLSMEKSDQLMFDLVQKVIKPIQDKEIIAFTKSEKDIKNMKALDAINKSKGNLKELFEEEREKITD